MGGAGDAAAGADAFSMGEKMIAYHASFTPPAPVIAAEIGSLAHPRRRRNAPALLDTGADITAIPETFAGLLDLYPIGRLQLEGVGGKLAPAFIYAVRLQVAGLVIPRLEAILTPFEFVVLGRDVLNQFYVRLDGPELVFAMDLQAESR